MSRIPFIAIDGKHYRWKDIMELRRSQLAAAATDSAAKLALFETLREDRRPADASTASRRYQQPTLFERGA